MSQLPPGFVLDGAPQGPQQSTPGLPAGFVLDSGSPPQQEATAGPQPQFAPRVAREGMPVNRKQAMKEQILAERGDANSMGNRVGSAWRGMVDVVPFASDAVAGLATVAPADFDYSLPAKERFERNRDYVEAQLEVDRDQNLGSSLAGTVGGAFLLPGSKFISRGKTLPGIAGRSAVVGGVYGGLGGASSNGDLGDRAEAAGWGGLSGGVIGGAVPGVMAGVGKAYNETLAPMVDRAASAIMPERTAERLAGKALRRDMNSGRAMSTDDIAAAYRNDQPITLADIGGDATRGLARAASNVSPEARGTLAGTTGERATGYTDRVRNFIGDLFDWPDPEAAVKGLRDAARISNGPAYGGLFSRFSGVWDDKLDRLLNMSPSLKAAARRAVMNSQDEAAVHGDEFLIQFPFEEVGGRWQPARMATGTTMPQTPGGPGATPDRMIPGLQFWDAVKRDLDGQINALLAGPKPNRSEARRLIGVRDALRNHLDEITGGEYKAVRSGAARFFGAEDALEAGEKFFSQNRRVDMAGARKALESMNEAERNMFAAGYASAAMHQAGSSGKLNKLKNRNEIDKARLALGDRADDLFQFQRIEDRFTNTRNAVEGNSSTARQLIDAGLLGAGAGVMSGMDLTSWGGLGTSAIVAGLRFAAGRNHGLNAKVAEKLGERLMTNDPQEIMKILRAAEGNPKIRAFVTDVYSHAVKASGVEAGKMAGDAQAPQGFAGGGLAKWTSRVSEAARGLKQERGTPEQMLSQIMKADPKAKEELRWGKSKIGEGMKSITKAELEKLGQENLPEIEEIIRREPPPELLKRRENAQTLASHARQQARYYSSELDKIANGAYGTEDDTYAKEIKEQFWGWREKEHEYNKQRAEIDAEIEKIGPPQRFKQYTLPGAQGYREIVLTNKSAGEPRLPEGYKMTQEMEEGSDTPRFVLTGPDGKMLVNATSARAAIAHHRLSLPPADRNRFPLPEAFTHESHWPATNNPIGHLRLSDRTGPNGEKILFIEELQSDWGQQAREQGIKGRLTPEQEKAEAARWTQQRQDLAAKYMALRDQFNQATSPEERAALLKQGKEITKQESAIIRQLNKLDNVAKGGGVPDGPFIDSTEKFTDLLLKRALQEAAQGDYTHLGWSPGHVQASRWSQPGLAEFYDRRIPERLASVLKDSGFDPKRDMTSVGSRNPDFDDLAELSDENPEFFDLPAISITDAIRGPIREKGMPLFVAPPAAAGAAAMGAGAMQGEQPPQEFKKGGPVTSEEEDRELLESLSPGGKRYTHGDRKEGLGGEAFDKSRKAYQSLKDGDQRLEPGKAPTTRQKMAEKILLGGAETPSVGRQQWAGLLTGEGESGYGIGLVDFVPGLGTGIGIEEGVDAYQQGDMFGAGAAAAGTALPFLGPIYRGGKKALQSGAGRAAAGAGAAGVVMSPDEAQASPLQRLGRLVPAEAGIYKSVPGKPATVDIPGVGRVEARPIGALQSAADSYMRSRGMTPHRVREYPKFDDPTAVRVARAFDRLKHDPSNPENRRGYEALIEETLGQYKALKDSGIEFKFMRDGMSDPYARSPSLGYADLVNNGRLWVFPTDFGYGSSGAFDPGASPMLKGVGRIGDKPDAVANDAFRVVHDAYGHFAPGNPFFRHQGEERAFIEHSGMYSPEARRAMATETRGQNSWLNFGPHAEHNRTASGADTIYADNKIALMPEWSTRHKAKMAGKTPEDDDLPQYNAGGAVKKVAKKVFQSDKFEAFNPRDVTNDPAALAIFDEATRQGAKDRSVIDTSTWGKPVFDYGKLRTDIPALMPERQQELPALIPGSRAAPPPENYQRAARNMPDYSTKVQTGLRLFPESGAWFDTMQLLDMYRQELGPEVGPQRWLEDMRINAAVSAGQSTPQEIRAASAAALIGGQGRGLPERLPASYGHVYWNTAQKPGVELALQGRMMSPQEQPKRTRYGEALGGNWQNIPFDRHVVRGMDINPSGEIDKKYYGFVEQPGREEARRLGMSPAEWMSSGWVGAGDETGLVSPPDPWLRVFEDRVQRTAKFLGASPEEVVRRRIRREIPLLAKGGLAQVAEMA